MRVTSIAKAGIGLTAFALLTGALAATPAFADPTSTGGNTPYGTLVGVGSDTTQDVVNGIASAIGGTANNPRIASYNAFTYNPDNSLNIGGLITTRSGGTAFPRPDGSGDGLTALLVSMGYFTGKTGTGTATTGTQWTTANLLHQVDFARSSSGPGSTAPLEAVSNGVVTYIPFARDAVDYAVSPDSDFPTLSVGTSADIDSDGVGASTLYNVYHHVVNAIATGGDGDPKLVNTLGQTNVYSPADGETLVPIHPYIPQASSGTAKFWVTAMGLTGNYLNQYVFNTQVTGGLTGAPSLVYGTGNTVTDTTQANDFLVQEHDGTALSPAAITVSDGTATFGDTAPDKGAIMPFSAAKWAADDNLSGDSSTGVIDARHGAVLGNVIDSSSDSIAPLTGSEGNYRLNTDYIADVASLTRLVYNIVPTAEVANSNSLTNWAFVGTGSLVCSQKSVITEYGFGLLTDASGASSCGDTSRRAVEPDTTSLVNLAKPSKKSGSYGTTFTEKATVSNSLANLGGTVEFQATSNSGTDTDAVTLGSATIPAGSSSVANATLSTPTTTLHALGLTAGTWTLTAVFEPNNESEGSTTSTDVQTIKIAKVTPTVKGSIASVSHTVVPVLKVTVKASGFVPVGSITVKSGSTVLGSADLVNGAATFNLPLGSKGSHTIKVTYNGDNGSNAKTISVTEKLK